MGFPLFVAGRGGCRMAAEGKEVTEGNHWVSLCFVIRRGARAEGEHG
jgi:hypothetical protein